MKNVDFDPQQNAIDAMEYAMRGFSGTSINTSLSSCDYVFPWTTPLVTPNYTYGTGDSTHIFTRMIPYTKIDKPSVVVDKVIVQPDKKVIVVIFANGDKSIVKCGKDDVFSVETGVAIAISKYVLGSGSEFKRVIDSVTIQEAKKKEATIDKFEVGDIVKTKESVWTIDYGDYSDFVGKITHMAGDMVWLDGYTHPIHYKHIELYVKKGGK